MYEDFCLFTSHLDLFKLMEQSLVFVILLIFFFLFSVWCLNYCQQEWLYNFVIIHSIKVVKPLFFMLSLNWFETRRLLCQIVSSNKYTVICQF